MKIVSASQINEIEKKAALQIGIPEIVMMENAAFAVVEECEKHLNYDKASKIIIIAGKGKNGGDGLAICRQLYLKGYEVGVIFMGDRNEAAGECSINLNIVENLNIPINEIPFGDSLLDIPYTIETCDLVIDAIFGLGFHGELTGYHEHVVEIINGYAKYVISVDCPSGIDADTGLPAGLAVKADKTITFTLPKLGLILYPGCEYAGEVVVKRNIIPTTFEDINKLTYNIIADEEVSKLLPTRYVRSHKGTYGRVFLIAGSDFMPGSAVLTAAALYKCGAGLVNAFVTKKVSSAINNILPEAITTIVPDLDGKFYPESFESIKNNLDRASVIIIGPGIGRGKEVRDFVRLVVKNAKAPLIIDADALTSIAEDMTILDEITVPCVITPHPGEMSGLTGLTVDDILKDPIKIAQEFSAKHNVVVLLKDARSVVVNSDGQIYINVTGCSAMAKAGSGDALCGIIGGLVSQGKDVFAAAILGAYLNGTSASYAAETLSNYGVLAHDIINSLPYVLKKYQI